MEIVVSNKASRPLYEQIVSQIKAQIMSGELEAGEALPSIRSLARSLQISVLTVQKAYDRYCMTKSSEEAREMYRKLDHMRWLRFYIFYNWSYGPVRDDAARQHPMLCPYEELTPEQRRERDAAWELMGNISVAME